MIIYQNFPMSRDILTKFKYLALVRRIFGGFFVFTGDNGRGSYLDCLGKLCVKVDVDKADVGKVEGVIKRYCMVGGYAGAFP